MNINLLRLMMDFEDWNLKEQFISAEIDRINHPEYFAVDFSCPDLDSLIQQVHTSQNAIKHQKPLNNFYDNLISSSNNKKSLYVRLKWLVYLNKLIYLFQDESVMYALTLKALQLYTDKFFSMEKEFNPFQNYLINKLFKPYIQYLSKLCLLYIPGKNERLDEEKQNKRSNYSSPDKRIDSNQGGKNRNSDQILRWYREYNFVMQTLQTFSSVLRDQEAFFRSQLPFLTNMRRYISKNLKEILIRLKQTLISLDELNMTMMQLDELETKITEFSKGSVNIFQGSESVLMTVFEDYTKEDITNFMCTPLKTTNLQ